MITADAGVAGDVYDATPDFAYAGSLLAALEGATGEDGHAEALPFLGIARAELVDFGRRPEGIAAAGDRGADRPRCDGAFRVRSSAMGVASPRHRASSTAAAGWAPVSRSAGGWCPGQTQR